MVWVFVVSSSGVYYVGRPKYNRMFLPSTVVGFVCLLPLSWCVTSSCRGVTLADFMIYLCLFAGALTEAPVSNAALGLVLGFGLGMVRCYGQGKSVVRVTLGLVLLGSRLWLTLPKTPILTY